MSPRSLRRQLQERDSGFRELLEASRLENAKALLSEARRKKIWDTGCQDGLEGLAQVG